MSLCLTETNSPHNPEDTIAMVKKDGSGIRLWGSFSLGGTRKQVKVGGMINWDKYKGNLEENLPEAAEDLKLGWWFGMIGMI